MRYLLILLAGLPVFAQQAPQTIDELIERVRNEKTLEEAYLRSREQAFLDARDEQKRLLAEARKKRQDAEKLADQLRKDYTQGEEDLVRLEELLREETGDMAELFTVFQSVASDSVSLVETSMVSAQHKGRSELLQTMSADGHIPSLEQARDLFLLFLDETRESGEVETFETQIITNRGEEMNREVIRIGTFTAISEGSFMRYLPESERLVELSRAPSATATDLANNFASASGPYADVAVDPSRGSILAMLVQAPTLMDRVNQGGLIGYLILLIGAVGLLVGLFLYYKTWRDASRIKAQEKSETPNEKNPLGQIMLAAQQDWRSRDLFATRLDEIMTTASRAMNRGLPTLAIFAAVSPLLGLLGTVTGMIDTFQAITLFGAGDPKIMSGGISQALVTTQLGLAVAIPLVLIHSMLKGRVNRIVAKLDKACADYFTDTDLESGNGGASQGEREEKPEADPPALTGSEAPAT